MYGWVLRKLHVTHKQLHYNPVSMWISLLVCTPYSEMFIWWRWSSCDDDDDVTQQWYWTAGCQRQPCWKHQGKSWVRVSDTGEIIGGGCSWPTCPVCHSVKMWKQKKFKTQPSSSMLCLSIHFYLKVLEPMDEEVHLYRMRNLSFL